MKTQQHRGYQFGTFKGVFTPSILTILGVIMFLRTGWVLGNVGLPATLLIVTVSSSITLITGLSISAAATNMKVGGGGAYYIISRSLGIEAGTAIGVPLFFAQALSIAFYISGFAEAFVGAIDVGPVVAALPFAITDERFVAIITLIVLTVITYISADLALKTQMFILGAIVLSLISFFWGRAPVEDFITAETVVPARLGFWTVFAVFFPAVTGIMAGVSMSGDLKKPSKALPLGTIAAVLVGYAVYMAIPIALSIFVKNPDTLLVRPMIMFDIARWGSLILLGVWAATLSSALGTLLGAPRTLQALARDRAVPIFLGKGYGDSNDPRVATGFSFVVALIAILLGDLNLIAPLLTMFFLTAYGLINLSAGLEGLIESPTWRPQFNCRWWISLFGAGACLATMLMLNTGATFMSLAIAALIYAAMKKRNLKAYWGDVRYGMLMLLVRFAIRKLLKRPADERNWRPNILVLSGSPQNRWYLIELAHALARDTSYLTVASIITGDNVTDERLISLENSISEYLAKQDVTGMVKVFTAEDTLVGAKELIKGYGFGPIEPNTVLLGETEKMENIDKFIDVVEETQRESKNLVVVREAGDAPQLPSSPRIDIWWRGEHRNIGLMLTLAYQLKKSKPWQYTKIVIKRIIEGDVAKEIESNLTSIFEEHRLDFETELIPRDGKFVFDIIHESSSDASLVLMGMTPPDSMSREKYAEHYLNMLGSTGGLPLAMVLSARNVDFEKIIGLG